MNYFDLTGLKLRPYEMRILQILASFKIIIFTPVNKDYS